MPITPHSPYSARRIWTLTKVWAALRDMPEVACLGVLLSGIYTGAAYTAYRINCTPVGASFPSLEVRRDPEKQVAYGPETFTPSIWYRIAQWRVDEHGYNTGIFNNRTRPFEYNLPTQTLAHSAPQDETTAGAGPASG